MEGLLKYVPDSQKTPVRRATPSPSHTDHPPRLVSQSLRARLIRDPYTLLVPPTWKETRVPNTISGNYCMVGMMTASSS